MEFPGGAAAFIPTRPTIVCPGATAAQAVPRSYFPGDAIARAGLLVGASPAHQRDGASVFTVAAPDEAPRKLAMERFVTDLHGVCVLIDRFQ